MDDFFAKTHWIVPLSNYIPTDAEERERELRGASPAPFDSPSAADLLNADAPLLRSFAEGKIRHNGAIETVGAAGKLSPPNEKQGSLEIEHSDRMA